MKKALLISFVLILILFLYTKLDKMPSVESISKDLVSWKSDAKIFKNKEYNLSYHDSKDETKEVILLLHGFPTSSYDWRLVWPKLSANYRLIAMDMLGFGFSDKPNDIQYSISMQADILEALLKELDVQKVHLLAHDYGDNIAQELLARSIENSTRYPLKIKSLVLLNGGLFPESHHPTTIQSLLRSPIGGVVASFTNATLFEKNFCKVFGETTQPSPQELTDQWYVICQQDGHQLGHQLTFAADDSKANRERWVGALKNTTDVPILFINGIADPVSGVTVVERYTELIPKAHVITLEGIGHFPQLEHSKAVINQVELLVDSTSGL